MGKFTLSGLKIYARLVASGLMDQKRDRVHIQHLSDTLDAGQGGISLAAFDPTHIVISKASLDYQGLHGHLAFQWTRRTFSPKPPPSA